MTPAKADQFIICGRRAMRQWQTEMNDLSGEGRGNG